jgi:hypothetical protein
MALLILLILHLQGGPRRRYVADVLRTREAQLRNLRRPAPVASPRPVVYVYISRAERLANAVPDDYAAEAARWAPDSDLGKRIKQLIAEGNQIELL